MLRKCVIWRRCSRVVESGALPLADAVTRGQFKPRVGVAAGGALGTETREVVHAADPTGVPEPASRSAPAESRVVQWAVSRLRLWMEGATLIS